MQDGTWANSRMPHWHPKLQQILQVKLADSVDVLGHGFLREPGLVLRFQKLLQVAPSHYEHEAALALCTVPQRTQTRTLQAHVLARIEESPNRGCNCFLQERHARQPLLDLYIKLRLLRRALHQLLVQIRANLLLEVPSGAATTDGSNVLKKTLLAATDQHRRDLRTVLERELLDDIRHVGRRPVLEDGGISDCASRQEGLHFLARPAINLEDAQTLSTFFASRPSPRPELQQRPWTFQQQACCAEALRHSACNHPTSLQRCPCAPKSVSLPWLTLPRCRPLCRRWPRASSSMCPR
mmetsp:Transcript_19632/g.68310  ORF Transcript_19632/g.68310 Transcript_19632/m.68310 type:complete len:296 (+) Transcript_19632:713-1600(+)